MKSTKYWYQGRYGDKSVLHTFQVVTALQFNTGQTVIMVLLSPTATWSLNVHVLMGKESFEYSSEQLVDKELVSRLYTWVAG